MIEYSELLEENDIWNYCNSDSADEKMDIICNKLRRSICLFDDSDYIYNYIPSRKVFDVVQSFGNVKVGENLKTILVQFSSASLSKFTGEFRGHPNFASFREEHAKSLKELESASFLKNNVRSVRFKLTMHGRQLDDDKDSIHFRNGVFNLQTCVFGDREDPYLSVFGDALSIPCISKYIAYDYDATEALVQWSTVEESIRMYFARIIPEACALHYIRVLLGMALSGRCSSKDCAFLCLLGQGFNGKRQIMRILSAVLTSVYCTYLPSSALVSETEAKICLASIGPSMRFLFIVDVPNQRFPISVIKAVCDGKVQARSLTGSGYRTVNVNTKLIMTSSHMLQFTEYDGGIRQRMVHYECKNRFVDADDEVNGVNIFKSEAIDFNSLSDIQKTNIFLYFALTTKVLYQAEAMPTSVYVFRNDHAKDFVSFLNTYFLPAPTEFVSASIFHSLVTSYFGNLTFTAKQIRDNLAILPVNYPYVVTYNRNKQYRNQVGCYTGKFVMLVHYFSYNMM
jgi:hypothetical protein